MPILKLSAIIKFQSNCVIYKNINLPILINILNYHITETKITTTFLKRGRDHFIEQIPAFLKFQIYVFATLSKTYCVYATLRAS